MDTTKLDPECVNLCVAMNELPGIRTTESCCGHGKDTMRVWFKADGLDVLSRMIFWFDCRFNGGLYWSVQVRTKAPSPGVIFMAESKSIGQPAYAEADSLAGLIRQEAEGDTSALRERLYKTYLQREIGWQDESENLSESDEISLAL